MRLYQVTLALLVVSGAVLAADAKESEKIALRELDAAESRWRQKAPKSYSYTVVVGGGFRAEEDVFRVSVHDGICKALKKPSRRQGSAMWASVPCGWLDMTELFTDLRSVLEESDKSVEGYGRYDVKCGYIVSRAIFSSIQDDNEAISVKDFRPRCK